MLIKTININISKKIQNSLFCIFLSVSISACAATSTSEPSSNNQASSLLGSLIAGAVVSSVVGGGGSSAAGAVDAVHGASTASSNSWLVPLIVAGATAAYENRDKEDIDTTSVYLPENEKKADGQLVIVRSKGQPLPRNLPVSVIENITLRNIPITISLASFKKKNNEAAQLNKLKQKHPNLLIQPNFYYYLNGKESRTVRPIPQYALKMLGFANKKTSSSQGRGIRIGIIDTPLDKSHPSFKGASISQINLLKNKNTGKLHATALTGILVGRGKLQGVAPRASITSVGVFEESKGSKSSGKSTSFLLAKAFDRIIGARVHVLNLSFGSTERDELMQKLVSAALKHKIKIVASVGNDGNGKSIRYPAALKGVMGITAVDSKARLYNRANTGNAVDYALPGVNIISSKPGGRYTSITGTSFANAYAAGLIALQLSKHKNLNALNRSAKDLGASGKDSRFGYGLLQR